MNIYVAIRQWFQPYYRQKPKGSVRKQEVPKADGKLEQVESVNGDKNIKCRVYTNAKPLTHAIGFKNKPVGDCIYCYHDNNVIQVFAHFDRDKNAGNKYPSRNNTARKKLKSIISITDETPCDRAHLIPIGYHGSENDSRLLVWWSAKQNQNNQREFEIKVKELNKKIPIYWLTSINRIKGGLMWHYRIWDATNPNDPKLKMKLDLEFPCKYTWS